MNSPQTHSVKHYQILNLNIDVASLTSGFHTLSLFMATPKGYATNFHNSFFYKIPLGGEGVKSYTYWVNSDRSHAITTHLDKVTNPLSLITMLDMPLQPFRSCDFEGTLPNFRGKAKRMSNKTEMITVI